MPAKILKPTYISLLFRNCIKCEPGTYIDGSKCIKCPKGNYICHYPTRVVGALNFASADSLVIHHELTMKIASKSFALQVID